MSIYIVSNAENHIQGRYKVGKHGGTQKQLITRYKTPLINPVIYFYYPCSDNSIMETAILEKLDRYRIRDENGKATEWINCALSIVVGIMLPILELSHDPLPSYWTDHNLPKCEQRDNEEQFVDNYELNKERKLYNITTMRENKQLCAEVTKYYHITDKGTYGDELPLKRVRSVYIQSGIRSVWLYAGDDDKHVEIAKIDTMPNYEYVLEQVKNIKDYKNPFGNRPREIDMSLRSRSGGYDLKLSFHKGFISLDDENINELFGFCNPWSHVRRYIVSIGGKMLIFEQLKGGHNFKVSEYKSPDSHNFVRLEFVLEGDENGNYKCLQFTEYDDKTTSLPSKFKW